MPVYYRGGKNPKLCLLNIPHSYQIFQKYYLPSCCSGPNSQGPGNRLKGGLPSSRGEGGHGSSHFPTQHSLHFQPQAEGRRARTRLRKGSPPTEKYKATEAQVCGCILCYLETQGWDRSSGPGERDRSCLPCPGHHIACSTQHWEQSLGAEPAFPCLFSQAYTPTSGTCGWGGGRLRYSQAPLCKDHLIGT